MASVEQGKGYEAAELANTAHFTLPVDTEHKATTIKLWQFGKPHMRAFHLSWMAFFTSFVSTFGAASLVPIIRDNINLTQTQVGNAAVASVCGAIAGRVIMGSFVDKYGPRYGIASLLLLTAPCVFCMSLITDATGFIVVRLMIGFSLASFVACQFWCGSMFNTKVVGTANALAAGWGNMGGGLTSILMPLVATGISSYTPIEIAWRWAFFVPGGMHVLIAIIVMFFSQDLPDGQYRQLLKSGELKQGKAAGNFKAALLNYRSWVMALTYGYCFGVELTADNVLPQYLFDQFNLSLSVAGTVAATFGLCNIFSRATGGFVSDMAARRFGMRGRLWALWTGATLGGVFCLTLGLVDYSLGATIAVMIIFSIFVQASCGLHFGINPFISKRSYGLVSGLVGAGGNAGSAVTQAIFFTAAPLTVQQGFVWMGVMIIGVFAFIPFVYFPMEGWGGMLAKGKVGVTEEDYYLSEYTMEERAQGLHSASLKFAFESRSQRGSVRGVKGGNATISAAPVIVAK